jgi:hypothetical protein
MKRPFETLPRRIFLDSCTAQTLRDYGGFIYEGEPIIELLSQSDAVLQAFLGIAGRRDILDAKRMFDAHGTLAEMLAIIDRLRVDRLEGSLSGGLAHIARRNAVW